MTSQLGVQRKAHAQDAHACDVVDDDDDYMANRQPPHVYSAICE